MADQFKNLNGPSADSVQSDYIAKERKAAEELLTIQLKNAQHLADLRSKLLSSLQDEALEQGKAVEDYLAEYGLQRRLDSLASELKAIQAAQTGQADSLKDLQQANAARLTAAEKKLGQLKAKQLAQETSSRLAQVDTQKQAELAALSEIEQTRVKLREELTKESEPSIVEIPEQKTELSLEPKVEAIPKLAMTEDLENLKTKLQLEPVTPNTLGPYEADLLLKPSLIEPIEVEAEVTPTINLKGLKLEPQELEVTQNTTINVDVDDSALVETERALNDIVNTTDLKVAAVEETKAAELAALAQIEEFEANTVEKNSKQRLNSIKNSFAAEESWQQRLYQDKVQQMRKAAGLELGVQEQRDSAYLEYQKRIEEQAEQQTEAEIKRLKEREVREIALLHAISDKKTGEPLFTEEDIRNTATLQERLDALAIAQKAAIEASIVELDAKQAADIETAKAAGADESALAAIEAQYESEREKKRALIEAEYAEKEAHEKAFDAAKKKVTKQLQKEEEKEHKKRIGRVTELKEMGKVGAVADQAGAFFNQKNRKQQMIADGLSEQEAAEELARQQKKAFTAMGNYLEKLEAQGKTIASKQSAVDTRLQGLSNDVIKTTLGSYWRTLEADVSKGVGISPFVKQEAVINSIENLANKGIAFNLEERAFLDTIKDKIATTFNAADGTLLKLVRIQQADTTAARLGMESALTSFLNSMYATTEYMTDAAASIRQNIYEATALMGAEEATGFEYQVQKWMGSLYSVGFSQTEALASALGKIAAGDISGVTEGNFGNLLVMAANQASLPIAQILEKGLTDEETNKLFKAMVEYLGQIYTETQGSNVLAQQFANVYGIAASDLKAAANLSQSLETIAEKSYDYDSLLGQLNTMAGSIALRTSTGDMFQNALDNFTFTLASTLSNNPVLSSLHQVANLLNDLVGGIELPFVNLAGFGFELNASVADLMNVAALSGTVLGGMGKLISSLSSGGGFSGSGLLKAFGVEQGKLDVNARGQGGINLTTQSGATTSESGYIGNENGDDVKQKTIRDAAEDPEKQIAEAKEEKEDKEEARTQLITGHIVDIYDLLQEVVVGAKKFHVQLEVGNNPASWAPGTWT